MSARTARIVGAAHLAGVTALGALAGAPPAAAQPPAPGCPDVQVVFARGTGEPPGFGGVGQSFVDAVRAQAAPRSVDVYPVNYPASADFNNRIQFAQTVIDGIRDAADKIEATAATCPDTQIVLGGYSQGAAVAGFVTAAEIPPGIPAEYRHYIPDPMPTEMADHVAAVVLFGKPSARWLQDVGAPPIEIGPAYADKTLDLCADGDTICNGAPVGGPNFAHASYPFTGLTNEGAAYAVARLAAAPGSAGVAGSSEDAEQPAPWAERAPAG
ncbi:Cutinase Cut1 [Mycolicibacterium phlei]|uniref:cutinase family protein n=2 Tax=Mycolicibacterium phlei TaxID=1771 RepID=UPI00078DFE7C|nr:Cutinase [Mycolicibacterium phlei]STZ15963.1 Cutinase Cut1 [Mycolicibacterium phlei]VEG07604.1 Cutinase Cut1 [Mycobacteroides chelonae]